jgi:hypothetical protein
MKAPSLGALALVCSTGIALADVTPPAPAPPPSKPPSEVRRRPAIPEPIRPILTDKPRGVIVREEHGGDFYFFSDPKADAFWTPSRDDVAALEKKLSVYVRTIVPDREEHSRGRPGARFLARFPDYTRQYVGIVAGKRRWIWVNFFCRDEGDGWMRGPVLVKDGGDCYGQVQFEPATERFRGFSVNGSG